MYYRQSDHILLLGDSFPEDPSGLIRAVLQPPDPAITSRVLFIQHFFPDANMP